MGVSGAHETEGNCPHRGQRSFKAGGFHLPSAPVSPELCYSSVVSLTGWISFLFSLDICIKSNDPSGNHSLIREAGSSECRLLDSSGEKGGRFLCRWAGTAWAGGGSGCLLHQPDLPAGPSRDQLKPFFKFSYRPFLGKSSAGAHLACCFLKDRL